MFKFSKKQKITFGIMATIFSILFFILSIVAITINDNNSWRYYMSVKETIKFPSENFINFNGHASSFSKYLNVSFGTGIVAVLISLIISGYSIIYLLNALEKYHLSPKSMIVGAYIIAISLAIVFILWLTAIIYAAQLKAVFVTATNQKWRFAPNITAAINHQTGPTETAGDIAILFYIGKFAIRAYSIAILSGIVAAVVTILYFWNRQGYKIEILEVLILITVPMGIVGARLWFVFERLIYEPTHTFPDWYKFWDGGLAIQGGVILAATTGMFYAYQKRALIDLKIGIGIILPAVIIGQAIGRWGNFANHEVYGKIDDGSSSSWLGQFLQSNMYIEGHFRVPLFFYEFVTSIVGYILIVWIMLFFSFGKPGTTAGMYLVWYGIVRVAMEPLREEKYLFYIILAILFILVGLVMLFMCQFKIRIKSRYKIVKAQTTDSKKVKRIMIYLDKEKIYNREKKWGGYIWTKVPPKKMSKRSINASIGK